MADWQPRPAGPAVGLVSVLNVLVFAVASVLLPPAALSVVGASLLIYGLLAAPDLLRVALLRILRLRWFMLAIAVLYLGGGAAGGLLAGDFSGAPQALHRVLVLIVLMLTVTLMLGALTPEELAGALVALLTPLTLVGLRTEALARRLAFTMDAVAHMDHTVRALRLDAGRGPVAILVAACEDAEAHVPRVTPVPELTHRPVQYWMVPVGMAAAVIALQWWWPL